VTRVKPIGRTSQPRICVYCGAVPDTRDHVPSIVLLDEPFPDDLPTVPACGRYNHSLSEDEKYLACFMECVVCGTTDPQALHRHKMGHILTTKARLRRRIDKAREDCLNWRPEAESIRSVVLKLATGHTTFELLSRIKGVRFPTLREPSEFAVTTLDFLSDKEKAYFEDTWALELDLLPKVGSRAFVRCVEGNAPTSSDMEMDGLWCSPIATAM
jgi:hypothetical protein